MAGRPGKPLGVNDPLISRHDEAETIPSGQRVVIFQTRTQDSIVLNPTGSWLWSRLESPRRLSWLVSALSQEHPEVGPETIRNDIEAYITEMIKNQVLVRQD